MPRIHLMEWERRDPDASDDLRSLVFSGPAALLAQALTKSDRLRVDELRQGVRIEATSFVGRVALDPLVVTITPKIAGTNLLRLFAYAYDLDDLNDYASTNYGASDALFVDLVVRQLLHEVRRLQERGLHRNYVRIAEELDSPRGAIDVRRLMTTVARGGARVPCVHHPRAADHLINRVVRAGLVVAARAAAHGATRVDAARAAAELEGVASMSLSSTVFDRVARALDRRTLHYGPALNLVEILWEGTSLDLGDDAHRLSLPGFLFDMNRFWQVLLGRLLRENLEHLKVIEDRAVHGALRYAAGFEHPRFRTPTARPDFVVLSDGQRIAVLDAKYRDLWARELPSAMLYQLAIYASVQGPGGVASILYPTQSSDARPVRIEVCPPGVIGPGRASVVLRPVRVDHLVAAVSGPMAPGERRTWVRELVGLPTG